VRFTTVLAPSFHAHLVTLGRSSCTLHSVRRDPGATTSRLAMDPLSGHEMESSVPYTGTLVRLRELEGCMSLAPRLTRPRPVEASRTVLVPAFGALSAATDRCGHAAAAPAAAALGPRANVSRTQEVNGWILEATV
jgi:hypothetical protein